MSTATISSNEALSALTKESIVLASEYAFQNPQSINGPFGSFTLSLGSNSVALGKMTIYTLFGLGTVTDLAYKGTYTSNGSTGYTTVTAHGSGTIIVRPHAPRYIEAAISITLAPGREAGHVSVSGFFDGLPCKRTYEASYPAS